MLYIHRKCNLQKLQHISSLVTIKTPNDENESNAGVSRSASIVIGFLMEHRGMSFTEAFDWVKTKRPKIQPNQGFLKQLKLYGVDKQQLDH